MNVHVRRIIAGSIFVGVTFTVFYFTPTEVMLWGVGVLFAFFVVYGVGVLMVND